MECRLFPIVPAGCAGKYDSARKNYLGYDLQHAKITGENYWLFPAGSFDGNLWIPCGNGK